MVEPANVTLQVFSPLLSDPSQVYARLPLLFASYEMCAEQFCQLEKRGHTPLREAIKPFLGDAF